MSRCSKWLVMTDETLFPILTLFDILQRPSVPSCIISRTTSGDWIIPNCSKLPTKLCITVDGARFWSPRLCWSTKCHGTTQYPFVQCLNHHQCCSHFHPFDCFSGPLGKVCTCWHPYVHKSKFNEVTVPLWSVTSKARAGEGDGDGAVVEKKTFWKRIYCKIRYETNASPSDGDGSPVPLSSSSSSSVKQWITMTVQVVDLAKVIHADHDKLDCLFGMILLGLCLIMIMFGLWLTWVFSLMIN